MDAATAFAAVYRDKFDELCRYLGRKFGRLGGDACEDLAQLAFTETLEKIRNDGFQPAADWWTYLRWLASNRAIDYLRQYEVASFETLAAKAGRSSASRWEPPDPGSPPSRVLAEAERRGRQGLTLSQVLHEFCRWCESRPDGYKMQEAYERSLRGQKPAEIASAMGMPRGTVDVQLKRARDWVLERVRQADVNRSVFETLHRRKPDDR